MTAPVAAQTVPEQRRCSCLAPANNPICSALGYGILGLFLSIPFGGGALLGVTSWACDHVLNWIYTKADISQNNTIGNIVKFALRFFAQACVSMLVLSAIGYPISFGVAALFAATTYLVPPCLVYALGYPFRTLINVMGVDVD